MAVLSTDARNRLKSSTFALPGRRFPIPDRAHAANAKARATQGVKAGTLTPAEAAIVRRKANRKLGKSATGVNADLNAATLGPRATPRANGSDNRNPATPYQEDINSWKSKPVTERGKWMNNSQGTGVAADTGAASSSKKNQAKFGGSVAPSSSSKKGQPKIGAGQTKAPISVAKKGQEKFGGTANKQSPVSGIRYSNGSSSMDSMKSMIRDH